MLTSLLLLCHATYTILTASVSSSLVIHKLNKTNNSVQACVHRRFFSLTTEVLHLTLTTTDFCILDSYFQFV